MSAAGGHALGLAARFVGSDTVATALTGDMLLPCDALIRCSDFTAPMVAPSIAFVLAEPMAGPHLTFDDVLATCRSVYAALEITDGASDDQPAGQLVRFTLGAVPVAPRSLNLSLVGCLFERNGRVVATATGAASHGHPAATVAAMVNALPDGSAPLTTGSFVLSGALLKPAPLTGATSITAIFSRLGRVGLAVR